MLGSFIVFFSFYSVFHFVYAQTPASNLIDRCFPFRADHPNIMASNLDIKNPINQSLPPPLSAVFKGSYAYKTVQERMPVILTKIVDHLSRHMAEIVEEKQFVGSNSSGNPDAEVLAARKQAVEDDIKSIIGAIAKLRNELQTNKRILRFPVSSSDNNTDAVSVNNEDLNEWNAALESLFAQNLLNPPDGPKWFESAWLFVESYMYRRVMHAVQQTKHTYDLDPFKWQKNDSVKESKESIHKILDYMNSTLENVAQVNGKFSDEVKKHFQNLLRLSLWGNKGDLSHSAGKEKSAPREHDPHEEQKKMREVLVVDETENIWQHFVQINNEHADNVRIDIICDNYGLELITDVAFGEFLIVSKLASEIRYHVKKMPWFVSDSTVNDFNRSLDVVNEHKGKYGEKWREYLNTGKFQVFADPFWTLPYDYDFMKEKAPELYEDLKKSHLIIFKGDLNYRKLTGDLAWSPMTPFRTALRSFHPAPLCTLRGLKAEVVVGLREGLAEEMSRIADDWMSSGNFAVVQFRSMDIL